MNEKTAPKGRGRKDTVCNPGTLEFQRVGRRRFVVDNNAGPVSSDGGLPLLHELEQRMGLLRRFAECFTDHRAASRVEHSVFDLLAQRIYGLVCGYEDLNDHDTLRHDPLLAACVGKADPTGTARSRERDRRCALAGRHTLMRLEHGCEELGENARYAKITHSRAAIENYFIDAYIRQQEKAPPFIILDIDATDDPLHGKQEGRYFHGYYGHYCYMPLYIFCGDHLLAAKLQTADVDPATGAIEQLARIVTRIRERWPSTEILVRGDSGFAREYLMTWCEEQGLFYLLGLARNSRLQERLKDDMAAARADFERTGTPARRFRDFRYRTLNSWTHDRRVVGKAEYISEKENPRFVVTNLPKSKFPAKELYERFYCARGDMENRIKEQQLGLFADRLSARTLHNNQLRLWFSAVAYVLLSALRRHGLKDTPLKSAQAWTIRNRVLKIGARVRTSVRRVLVSLSSAYPFYGLFARILDNLRTSPPAFV